MTSDDEACVPAGERGSPSNSCPHDRTGSDDLIRSSALVDLVLDDGTTLLDEMAVEALVSEAEDHERAVADRELYELLRTTGFDGEAWDLVAAALIRHGAAVLYAWSRSGWIFKALADKGIWVKPAVTGRERRRVAEEIELQQELVRQAVSAALSKFQRELQQQRGWTPDAGMSLKSYFVGACIYAFGNEFRKWRRRDALRYSPDYTSKLDSDELADLGHGVPAFGRHRSYQDPAEAVLDLLALREAFETLESDVDRNIVWGKASGDTAAQIAELYPELTRKAVEHRWDRLKRSHEWINRLAEMVRK